MKVHHRAEHGRAIATGLVAVVVIVHLVISAHGSAAGIGKPCVGQRLHKVTARREVGEQIRPGHIRDLVRAHLHIARGASDVVAIVAEQLHGHAAQAQLCGRLIYAVVVGIVPYGVADRARSNLQSAILLALATTRICGFHAEGESACRRGQPAEGTAAVHDDPRGQAARHDGERIRSRATGRRQRLRIDRLQEAIGQRCRSNRELRALRGDLKDLRGHAAIRRLGFDRDIRRRARRRRAVDDACE